MREPKLVGSKRKPFLILRLSRQQKDLNITPTRTRTHTHKWPQGRYHLKEGSHSLQHFRKTRRPALRILNSTKRPQSICRVLPHSTLTLKRSQVESGMKRFVSAALPNGVKANKIYYGKLT